MSTYAGQDPIPSPPVTAGKGTWPDLITIPDDGDPRAAASVNVALEGLADRTQWLAEHSINFVDGASYVTSISLIDLTTVTTTGDIEVGGALTVTGDIVAPTFTGDTVTANTFLFNSNPTFDRSVEHPGYPDFATTAFWDFVFYFWTVNSAAAGHLCIPLHLPHGCALNSARARINPAGGHAAFPGGAPTMPSLVVKYREITTGSETTLKSQTDTSATAGAYEAAHWITATLAAAHTVDREANVYYLSLFTEAGANAIAGTVYYGATVNYTVAEAVTE